jgi:CPA1 family monovalent cation:H+ antiporter
VRRTGDSCEDLADHPAVETAEDPSCQACLDAGVQWVSLRQCLTCGEVSCCDSSPLRHATEHFHESAHPVIESAEPGEDWRWCFVHHTTA